MALFFPLLPFSLVLVVVRFERALALELVLLECACVHLAPRNYLMTPFPFFAVIFPLALVQFELRLEKTMAVPLTIRQVTFINRSIGISDLSLSIYLIIVELGLDLSAIV